MVFAIESPILVSHSLDFFNCTLVVRTSDAKFLKAFCPVTPNFEKSWYIFLTLRFFNSWFNLLILVAPRLTSKLLCKANSTSAAVLLIFTSSLSAFLNCLGFTKSFTVIFWICFKSWVTVFKPLLSTL